eukprot:TRINITY_DN104197_c0_g1_i1.p1 TRINITY_DN104197_c0_g1~~TRINITY_DN104197_c0_g1_i1.p1  ORF type:complete len:583 (-),score=105.57 TRINITY_DN104197_c0_g1_i1:80-1828(-)
MEHRRSTSGLRRQKSKLRQDSGSLGALDEHTQQLYKVFQQLDKDRSGTLSLDEVSSALESLGESVAMHELERLMKSLDTSDDGLLDFEEFKELIEEVMKLKKLRRGKFEALDAGRIEAQKRGQVLCWSIVACISYIVAGCLYGSYRHGWGFSDSIYFVVATVSTVGYGDMSFVPGNKLDKIFGCFYVLFGVACVSCALGLVIDVLNEAAKEKMHELTLMESLAVAEGRETQFNLGREIGKLHKQIFKQSVLVILTACVGACCFVEMEKDQDWSFVDGLYFACVTMTTVGYGDLEVKSEAGKMFTSIYILIAFSVIAAAMSELASLPSEVRRLANLDKVLGQFGESLDEDELEALCDGEEIQQLRNGQQIEAGKLKPAVSRAEFALWQLLKQGKLDLQKDVAPCLHAFDKLDYDGSGVVTREDISQCLHDELLKNASLPFTSDECRLTCCTEVGGATAASNTASSRAGGEHTCSKPITTAEVVADSSHLGKDVAPPVKTSVEASTPNLPETSHFSSTLLEHAESTTPYLPFVDEVSELEVLQRNAFRNACDALRRATPRPVPLLLAAWDTGAPSPPDFCDDFH